MNLRKFAPGGEVKARKAPALQPLRQRRLRDEDPVGLRGCQAGDADLKQSTRPAPKK